MRRRPDFLWNKMRHRQDLSNKMRRRPDFLTNSQCLLCPIYIVCNLYSTNHPLHRIEFGLPKFFSNTFKFSIIFYSTLQISGGGGHSPKAYRSRKKESKL